MEIEPANVAQPRADQHVGRIAGQPRAGDAVLHHVERFHHHGRNAGAAAPPEELPAQRAFAPKQAAQPVRFGRLGGRRFAVIRAVIGNDGAAPEQIGIDIDRDHQPGAERARRRNRHRIDQRAVHQPAPADQHRWKNSRQRIGGAQRLGQPAAGEPDFMAGIEFGGDGGEADRQIVDAAVGERGFQLGGEVAAADEPGPGQADVEIAQDAAYRQLACPFFQAVELAGGITAADHGADRGADNDVRHDAVRGQRAHHADMGEATRGTAAEREPDARARDGRLQRRGDGFRRAVAVAHARE